MRSKPTLVLGKDKISTNLKPWENDVW